MTVSLHVMIYLCLLRVLYLFAHLSCERVFMFLFVTIPKISFCKYVYYVFLFFLP